jgi:hypothetical protein
VTAGAELALRDMAHGGLRMRESREPFSSYCRGDGLVYLVRPPPTTCAAVPQRPDTGAMGLTFQGLESLDEAEELARWARATRQGAGSRPCSAQPMRTKPAAWQDGQSDGLRAAPIQAEQRGCAMPAT